jgi:hypothetical protein
MVAVDDIVKHSLYSENPTAGTSDWLNKYSENSPVRTSDRLNTIQVYKSLARAGNTFRELATRFEQMTFKRRSTGPARVFFMGHWAGPAEFVQSTDNTPNFRPWGTRSGGPALTGASWMISTTIQTS